MKLPTLYQEFIHLSRYAKWDYENKRRETWPETVDRYISFWVNKYPNLEKEIKKARKYILNLEVMPSMRCLMTAGIALDRDNCAGYNCSYLSIDHPRAFDEILYILMCGTGVGFSVERQFVGKLPEVSYDMHPTDTTILVTDSKIGWAKSFKELISLLYSGQIPNWDLSKLRPAGSPLKTFGGRSSGPEPLDALFKFTVKTFKEAAGRRLSSLECHDLVCKIAEIVVVGGVRRSALISLSNVSDDRLRSAKSGQWYVENSQRALANNSACYNERPEFDVFLKEWESLYQSKSGERGIFSRVASQNQMKKTGRRDPNHEVGTNPCSEIILRSNQFCNLTEVVVRPDDTLTKLKAKVKIATLLGTLQSSLTDFRYLRPIWKKNTEEECLLGVSFTGIMDNPLMYDNPKLDNMLESLKEHAISVNKNWAEKLGVNQSTSITCVKPSGTVSQLVDSSSGIHPRYSPYYIRRVRNDVKDPLTDLMISQGFPYEKDNFNPNAVVFSFPMKSPESAKIVSEYSALEQLELWEKYQDYWCEHKPSVTVYYQNQDFLKIGAWIWDNFNKVSGVSFLPHSDHVYEQAPYEEITKDKYEELVKEMPTSVDWALLSTLEEKDNTTATKELACTGGACEI